MVDCLAKNPVTNYMIAHKAFCRDFKGRLKINKFIWKLKQNTTKTTLLQQYKNIWNTNSPLPIWNANKFWKMIRILIYITILQNYGEIMELRF